MIFHKDHTTPAGAEWIWVFGSNLGGRHGKGAAKVAHTNFGAQYGPAGAHGLTGRAYAIPTKDARLNTLPLADVEASIKEFLQFAKDNPTRKFFVTRVGCVLAGFSDAEIAPLFRGAPANCSFVQEWEGYLHE